MTQSKTQVTALLKEHQDERGIEHRKKRGAKERGLKSFGIGLTRLRAGRVSTRFSGRTPGQA